MNYNKIKQNRIKKFGKTLELAKEGNIKVRVNGFEYRVSCTPVNIKELEIGLTATNFFGIHNNACSSKASNACKSNKHINRLKYSISELKENLKFLDVEEYKKTRGYHIAVAVFENKAVAKAYDVSRHYALAKVIGMCIKKRIKLEDIYIILSGRISKSIVEMCFNAGIPLIVSKAAIFDSAIEFCLKNNVSAVSFATGIAVGCAVKL